ncbi:MAG: thioredoxin-disulfide reductase [bacterium]|nr:thioredoxin-disulfide reductase [Candidatus Microgenomates bacterium CPR3]MCQ3944359.1 thioredoxin-disulfide reductase [bacterium]RIK51292.1 MAG: thioredoxin-disulfide reductase [Candidatus Microgenomates bacterium]
MNKRKVAIVGSGPAGLAAAIYTSRAEIDTVVYAGEEPGGQLTKTTEIENYPGVVRKTGPELMVTMTQQATKFGARIEYETVTDLDKLRSEYDAVILAMGASPRLLGIGEEKYWGKGFSTCAVCDAAFYKGKNVYVVGGGDSAIEDATALTKFASHVTILVRGDKWRASVAMQKRLENYQEQITVMWKTNLKEIQGERVEKLVLDVDGVEKTVEAEGLFFAIGHIPATGFLKDSNVELDHEGYILTQAAKSLQGVKLKVEWPTMTNVAGVFAAGDCVDHRYRQAGTAVGMGIAAALDCERWLNFRQPENSENRIVG